MPKLNPATTKSSIGELIARLDAGEYVQARDIKTMLTAIGPVAAGTLSFEHG
jgi:hypothetical protein